MNKDVTYVPLGKLLKQVIREEKVEADKVYKVLGARWYAKGLYIKYIKEGSDIKAKKMYLVKEGDFVYSRLFAWKGSFGLAGKDVDNCYVSNEFPCFEVNDSLILPQYLRYIFFNEAMWNQSLDFSEGSTAISRNRLKVERFLSFEIPLPSLESQKEIVERLSTVFQLIENLNEERDKTSTNLQMLRNKILECAVQGKLVSQDENDEPASVLLRKIKEEKEQLIKEKKIKKEKSLPQITDEEKPFELPNGWEWGRFNEVLSVKNGISKRAGKEGEKQIVLRLADIKGNKVSLQDYRKIMLTSKELETYKVDKQGLLFIRVNGSFDLVGKAVLYQDDIPVAYCDHLMFGLLPESIDVNYFWYMFNSVLIRQQLSNKITTTAGQNTINQKNLGTTIIPIPPTNEQMRIVEKVNQLMFLCNELETNIEQSKQKAEKLMKAVLQEAFTVKEEVLS